MWNRDFVAKMTAQDDLRVARARIVALEGERDQARAVAESMQQNYDQASHQHYESMRECIALKARVKELEGVIRLCKFELAWLIDQVKATPGGSVWQAYEAAKAALLTEVSDG